MAPMPSQWLQRVPSPQTVLTAHTAHGTFANVDEASNVDEAGAVQGYLAHKKTPPPLGAP